MAINEENISPEFPEDNQLNDDLFDTNSLARATDKNTPIGVRNAADNGENLVALVQRMDKNTPIG